MTKIKEVDAMEGEVVEDVEEENGPDEKEVIEDKDLEKHMTKKQILFCKVYATKREFFANGVESYSYVYNIDLKANPSLYNSVKNCANRLLLNVVVCRYINIILDLRLSNEAIDKELMMLAVQNEDRRIKLDAIKEVNKLRGRIIDRIADATGENPLEDFNSKIKKKREVVEK